MVSKNEILVSVCCLAYNHEKYIKRTLEGFISQKTTFNFEVLIHDDASTDNTQNIIKEYAEKYPDIIKPILQKENQLSKGINVQKTYNYPRIKGKYVAYCEGDDYWCDENKLQLQVDSLEIKNDCTISAHITEIILKDGTSKKEFIPPHSLEKKIITIKEYLTSELVERNWTFHLSSFMVRKEIIDLLMEDNITFIKAFNRIGDFALIAFSLTRGNLVFIDRKMSCYRWMSGGFMSNWTKNSKSITDSFINGYNELDKYTNYKYHDILAIGIKNCEFSQLIKEENFTKLTSEEYKFIYDNQPKIKKFAINVGKHSKTLYHLLMKVYTTVK